jgi:hypothetical protein
VDLKIGEIGLGWFSKALSAALRICDPIGAKDFNVPVFKSFEQMKQLLALHC